jgi:2-polyprenyl-6-methoxyphenol hydroxylase-like FAD-dependent oxidoreductase
MRNLSPSETDVLIVGAGPVGLMLACELRRRDIACCIIDKVSDFPQTSRANGLQPRSMEVFDSLGVADQVLARGYPVHGISVMRGGREVTRSATRSTVSLHRGRQPGDGRRRPAREARRVRRAGGTSARTARP